MDVRDTGVRRRDLFPCRLSRMASSTHARRKEARSRGGLIGTPAVHQPRRGSVNEQTIPEIRVMSNAEAAAIAAEVLSREGLYLDRKDWKAWLVLFCEDVEYWVPTWLDEYDTTADPKREISLIYHASRQGLAERIARIQTRKSVTAMPLPRTAHFIANVIASLSGSDEIEATASWQVQVHDPRTCKNHVLFGIGEYRL